MAGLNDLYTLNGQLVTVLDDNDTTVKPFTEQCLHRKRHARCRFTAAGNEYVLHR